MKRPDTSQITFDEVKRNIDITTVAALLGIHLKKKGNDHFAACPLPGHMDSTASFTVGGKRSDQFFCFGCGIGGDMFDLVEAVNGLNKQESFLWLADQAGLLGGERQSVDLRPVKKVPAKVQKTQIEEPLPDLNLYDEIYTAVLESLPKEKWGIRELSRRGLAAEYFIARGYRHLPYETEFRSQLANRLAAQFKLGENRRVPGFFKNGRNWCFLGNRYGDRKFSAEYNQYSISLDIPALILPSRSVDRKVQYLKMRNPDFPLGKIGLDKSTVASWKNDSDERYVKLKDMLEYYPPKYQVVSSALRPCGVGASLKTHFSVFTDFYAENFILTEGEFKGDIIADHLKLSTAALAGVNLHQDKFMYQLTGCEEVLSPVFDLPDVKLKSFEQLLAMNPVETNAEICHEHLDPSAGHNLYFAFDRDNSIAVVNSLLKFQFLKNIAGDKCRHNFHYIFWREESAKGFDDLLQTGENFFILPFENIWDL